MNPTKRQKKLGTYLTVTITAGCASSAVNAAIQSVDLSGLGSGALAFPTSTGDSLDDLIFNATYSGNGYINKAGSSSFYSDVAGALGVAAWARSYASGIGAFPSDPDTAAVWNAGGPGGGFVVGANYVAFKDSAGNFGWMKFTLNSLGVNSTGPVDSFDWFRYDDASTSPANAISLQTAIAYVPEPSALALFALGSAGLLTRRSRSKAV